MLESNGRMDVIEFNLKHVDFKLTSFHKQREARFQVFKIVLCLRRKEQFPLKNISILSRDIRPSWLSLFLYINGLCKVRESVYTDCVVWLQY